VRAGTLDAEALRGLVASVNRSNLASRTTNRLADAVTALLDELEYRDWEARQPRARR
jgi:hypothetical protein